jgi:hypothetical protein
VHEATSPCIDHRSLVLRRSDAILARSAAAWKLPDPHPPSIGRGGGRRELGPHPNFHHPKKAL